MRATDNPPMRAAPTLVTAWAAGTLAACAPALDWREVRPAQSDVVALFPCRPDRVEREVALAGRRVRLAMLSCSVGADTFALAGADTGDPAAVTPALGALRAAVAANLGASAAAATPAQVPGATPNEAAARLRVDGRRPDGSAVVAHAVFFARGTGVWQATVLGPAPAAEAVDTFVGALQAGR
jgi:hypothetical protein